MEKTKYINITYGVSMNDEITRLKAEISKLQFERDEWRGLSEDNVRIWEVAFKNNAELLRQNQSLIHACENLQHKLLVLRGALGLSGDRQTLN